jgi:hypothetical protein
LKIKIFVVCDVPVPVPVGNSIKELFALDAVPSLYVQLISPEVFLVVFYFCTFAEFIFYSMFKKLQYLVKSSTVPVIILFFLINGTGTGILES